MEKGVRVRVGFREVTWTDCEEEALMVTWAGAGPWDLQVDVQEVTGLVGLVRRVDRAVGAGLTEVRMARLALPLTCFPVWM